jgi:hypothetical protein
VTEAVAPEFARFLAAERNAGRAPVAPVKAAAAGEVIEPVFIEAGKVAELLRVAARRASGLIRPTKRTEVVWVDGASELAVNLVDLHVTLDAGLVIVHLPVRCDQVQSDVVDVAFAVGSPDHPAGLFASTYRRPNGSEFVVTVWGEALVAFAWQCLLGLVAGIAGATGKDARGNVMVPVELSASPKGLSIVPMARHRFSGSTGLVSKVAPR